MDRHLFLVVAASAVALSVTSCAPTVRDISMQNRMKINQLGLEMDREQVDHLLGTGSVTVRKSGLITTSITNPHRTESVRDKSQGTVEVRYYVTDVIEGEYENEFSFTDDELTPLVFRDRRLVGWGWNLLFENVDRTQLHQRNKSNRPDLND